MHMIRTLAIAALAGRAALAALATLATLATLAACGGAVSSAPQTAQTAQTARPWPVPAGFRSETIPFPLDFAPSLAHRGVEHLRFAPSFFDPAAPGYWSYAFVWRLDDPAALAPDALAAELTTYFRGLARHEQAAAAGSIRRWMPGNGLRRLALPARRQQRDDDLNRAPQIRPRRACARAPRGGP